MRFTKMHGWGNDFVIIEGPAEISASRVAALCDRRTGIGADGLIEVAPGARPSMRYWNADGSAAEMCGNGLRCVARFAHDRGWAQGPRFEIETALGPRRVEVLDGSSIGAELGEVSLGESIEVGGGMYQLVDVGNPHAVKFVDDPDGVDLVELGESLQRRFEAGINVEVAAAGDGVVRLRVWERGVGETRACGTGMVAAAAAASGEDPSGEWQVSVPGGTGIVRFESGSAWLEGPAEYSFRGTVETR